MEAYLTNVPRHLTDRTLEKELWPHMNALGILDWACSTKSKNNKGWVTFLNAEDGKRFLKRHGKEILPDVGPTFKPTPKGGKPPKDRARANLLLMNTHVWVAPSNRAPDPFMIKSLKHRLEEKYRQRTQQDAPSTDDAIVFQVSHLACGHNTFQRDKTLTFNEQCRLSQRGLAKFRKRMLILKFEQGVKVEIPHSSIVEIIHSSDPSTFTLLLSEPPRFYYTKSDLEEQMERLGLIDDSKRPQVLWTRPD
ncbi:RNA-dependent RNA polymerase [Colletotrichum acutatum]